MADPIVEINDGKLKGTIKKNYKDEDYYAFLGIPFAKPPVGELRFKAPQPVEPWEGVKEAVEDGSQCFQFDMITFRLGGSEDCLHLNVYTKNVSDSLPLKPVLVYIHGGAFTMGSNSSKVFSPKFLMMEDIVVVIANYRLGILGFLRLNDVSLGVPGNAGLKDQLLALKWVQKNIKKFGGDPNNVTIYGESAGAASVNYHVISPASKGLFHKAIMHSGSVLNTWPHLPPNSLDVMKFLKDDCKNETEMLEVLMNSPVDKLIDAQMKLSAEMRDNKLQTFAPCVEEPNDTAFLTRTPIDVIMSGDFNQVPMIIGYNSNEGLIFLLEKLDPVAPKDPKIPYETFVPFQMNLPADSEERKKICEKLKAAYSNDKSGDRYLIAGDALFVVGIIAFAENAVRYSTAPVYFHRLNLDTSRNAMKRVARTEEPGACHGDDLGYIFDNEMPLPVPGMNRPLVLPGSIEEKAINRYIKLWGNFLKSGNPTPDANEFGLIWKPMTAESFYYLDVDKEISLKTNPDEERVKLWREIYKSNENTKNFLL